MKALWYLLRRTAAAILRCAQGLPFYRYFGVRVSPRITIEEASLDDMEKAHQHFSPSEPYLVQPLDPNVTNWVAKRGQKVVGFVQLVRNQQKDSPWRGYWLFSLEVWNRYRGLGIGKRLSQFVIAQAIKDGAPELLLTVFQDNTRAISLYQKVGFEQVTLPDLEPLFEAEKQQFGRRRIVMRKNLRQ